MKNVIAIARTVIVGRNGRLRRELRRLFVDPVAQIRRHPLNVGAWVDLIHRELNAGRLPAQSARLASAHRIERRGAVGHFLDEIAARAGAVLRPAAADPTGNLPRVIEEIVRWKAIIQCRSVHAGDAPYFPYAEGAMSWQWPIIWPIIAGSDFSTVLELAPGHGRNTERLREHAKTIHLVDVNQSCIDACRARFGERKDGCRFFYHVTDGTRLHDVADGSITFVYSWDSMVHFDKLVVRGYMHELARVLVPGGRAFLHMSNYGSIKPDIDWATNFGARSNMSMELLKAYAAEAGLDVPFLRPMTGWDQPGNPEPLDFLTVVSKR
jgi:SAM-dependent methyltransferase